MPLLSAACRRWATVIGAVSLVAAGAAAPALAQSAAACRALAAFTLPGVALEIDKAEHVPAGPAPAGRPGAATAVDLPAHCLIEGAIDRRIGVGGKPYVIGFALALPDDWTGRFLFQGGGGLNGTVRPPFGAQAAGDEAALARGFAVVSTDTGHRGATFDGSFFEDQEAALNFLYAANAKVASVAAALIAARYERPADHSYFVGCSTGGREGMMMSQRHPTLFDGIVAGAPAMRTGFSNLGMRSMAVALGSAPLADADKKLVVDSLVAACDTDDGLADGMLSDPMACDFDPSMLVCSGAKHDACLTAEQAAAIEKAMAGPKDASGAQVYPGYLWDTGLAASGEAGIPGILHGAAGPVGPRTPPTTQDVDAEAAIAAAEPNALGNTHAWTNLSTFRANGGKLLFYHGVSDPWFSALDTIRYYERLAAANGGQNATADWSRLFLVPGMGHCGGGDAALDRFDLLTAIVAWVERDAAPDSVLATGAAFPNRSRPLCPYPEHAHYTGRGNPDDAASFTCQE